MTRLDNKKICRYDFLSRQDTRNKRLVAARTRRNFKKPLRSLTKETACQISALYSVVLTMRWPLVTQY